MLEIEIKAYCTDLIPVIKRITELGGRETKRQIEIDQYFNHPDHDFRKTDEALRIRTHGQNHVLTYKGPKISANSKARFEQETKISSPEEMTIILEKLGYMRSGIVEKSRIYFRLNEVEICCDNINGLGSFVELEIQGDDLEISEQKLFQLAVLLRLDRFEKRSYLELLALSNKL